MSASERSSTFTSRWGMLLVMLGMAVGTGNIWRFPRIAATNGGGTFLIPWAIFLLSWSVPLLLVEFAMGKAARRGPIGAFATLVGESWAWMGAWVALCATGRSRWWLFGPSVLVATAFVLGVGAVGGVDAIDRVLPIRGPVVRAVDGSLVIRRSEGLVLLDRAGRLRRVDAVPRDFVPVPYDATRLRRQLLALGSPWRGVRHPLDPFVLRWLCVGWGIAAAAAVLGASRPARLPWLLVPAGAVFLLL